MTKYKCKKPDCKGIINFDNSTEVDETKNLYLAKIAKEPEMCSQCGTSYYEYELKGYQLP